MEARERERERQVCITINLEIMLLMNVLVNVELFEPSQGLDTQAQKELAPIE